MNAHQPTRGRARAATLSPAAWAVIAFLASRALMIAVGWAVIARNGVRHVDPSMLDHRYGVVHGPLASQLLGPWANWDGQWFVRVASAGYLHKNSQAFFPLYPLAVRGVHYLTGSYVVAGTIVSWGAIALALWLLYRMVAARFDPTTAAWTVAFLSFFPTSFYLTSVYSESLFLLFSIAAFYFGERRNWALAGLAGMLAVLTRNTGLLLLIPLALLMVEQDHAKGALAWARALFRPRTLWLGLVPLGLLLYMGFLQVKFGQPLLFAQAQNNWDRRLSSPVGAVSSATVLAGRAALRIAGHGWHAWTALLPGGVSQRMAGRTLVPWLTLLGWAAVTLAAIRRLPFAYTAWSLVLLVYPLFFPAGTAPLLSYQRFALVAFPLFIALAVLTRHHGATRVVVLAVSAALMVWMAATFALWWWVA
jgi:hypothetical protein